jgi:hypothetical protein
MKIEKSHDGYHAFNDANEMVLSVTTYETTMPKNGYEEEELCTIDAICFYGKTKAQEQAALKEIFVFIRDEFGRYPGIDNHFSTLDAEESELIATLISEGYIPKQLLLNAEESMCGAEVANQKVMQNLMNATTEPRVPNNTRSGYIPYTSEIKTRVPRNFAKERTAQLLRQIATQLFHFCCSRDLNPTEVEVMYLNKSLYISANSKQAVNMMNAQLQTKEAFKAVITASYSYNGCSSFDTKTSKRHAAKLLARLYDGAFFNSNTDKRAVELWGLLSTFAQAHTIILPDLTPIKKEPGIYFVCNKFKADRHAEENLMDILDAAYPDVLDAPNKPAIYGKKRPCITCHSRLNNTAQTWIEDFSLHHMPFDFNHNNGLLFKNAAYKQKGRVASATASTLGQYSSNVYISTDGGSGYATVSDSEPEVETEQDVGGIVAATAKLQM